MQEKKTIGFISVIFILIGVIFLTVLRDGQFVDRYSREVKDKVKKDSLAQYNSDQLLLMHHALDSISAKLDSVCRLIETRNDNINNYMSEGTQQTKATIKSLKK